MINAIVQIPLESVQTAGGEAKSSRGNNPCLICGKEIKEGSEHKYVQLLTNGNIVSTDEEMEDSQGMFPVGSDCAKKLVIKFSF